MRSLILLAPLVFSGCDYIESMLDVKGGEEDSAVDIVGNDDTGNVDTGTDDTGTDDTGDEIPVGTDEDGDGVTVEDGDCDDSDDSVYPGAVEICDGIDNDCNGMDDAMFPGEDGSETDDDGDGVSECEGDCDDTNAAIGAGIIWFPDMDGDGFGDEDSKGELCDRPESWYVSNNEDCDDTDETSYPGATEIRANYIDEDCDGDDLVWDTFSLNKEIICGIDTEGDLLCAGSASDERVADAPEIGDGPFTQVSVGVEHVCATSGGGDVMCWGDDEYDECWEAPQDSMGSDQYAVVAASMDNTLGISDNGYLMVWGRVDETSYYTPDLYNDMPSGNNYVSLVAEEAAACAIMASGLMRCWGNEDRGAVSEAPSSGTYLEVDIGRGSSSYCQAGNACAVQSDNSIVCWEGAITTGCGGRGLVDNVPSGSYMDVSIGSDCACAISTSGSLRCWENDGVTGSLADEPPGSFQDIHVDTYQAAAACALDDDGYITCWGSSSSDVHEWCVEEDDPGFSDDYFGCSYYE